MNKDLTNYFNQFPPEVQVVLENIRRIIQKKAPKAEEKISYGIPTYSLQGNLIHFAAFKKHIGLYPTPKTQEAFQRELAPYKTGKGSIQFPLDRPIPYDLIEKIVEHRVREHTLSKKK